MASKSDNSASIDDTNDADSVSKEIINTLEGSESSSEIQSQDHLEEERQPKRHPPTYVYSNNASVDQVNEKNDLDRESSRHSKATEDQLGPLPNNWEKAFTDTGEAYFIDHNTGTSHWLDPRLSKFQKRSLEECRDDELPYGWEKIEDTLYGTYFIDHVNRRTQYENPVIQAKREKQNAMDLQSRALTERKFTRDPDELIGQRLRTTLLKGSRGLGITIVGADDNCQDFLQIKSIVPNGPAWLDAKLQTGDVLVYVNDICVLGFTHNEMVNVFKSIGTGETVTLEVCRGYPLPFDPNDPNNQVVTTIAVNAPDILTEEPSLYMDLDSSGLRTNERFDYLDGPYNIPAHNVQVLQNMSEINNANTSISSMPDLCISDTINSANDTVIKRPSSTDLLSHKSVDQNSLKELSSDSPVPSSNIQEFYSIPIVKGAMGFGFTIADSSNGQKVKKILDRQRCKNLMEGDILININDVNVRTMCHTEVVQVLKNCSYNDEALIHIQRSCKSPKLPVIEKNCLEKEKKKPLLMESYRSQTPSADIYSTQVKAVVPSRSKTPLIDTRTCINEICSNEVIPGCYKYNGSSNYYDYSHLTENFAAMNTIDANESMSEREEWLTNGNMYAIDIARSQHLQQGPIFKQNGNHNPDFFPYHQQYIDQNYSSYAHIGQEQHVDTSEVWDKGKETTSFEHEQPLSSSNYCYYPQYGNCPVNDLVCPSLPDIEWVETLVTLVRQDNGFGFRIVGGTEEGSQVSVGHIVPGGAADLDGRLNSGDLIMSVDGESVMNSSHHRVVQLMIAAAQNGQVTLGIRRRVITQDHHSSSAYGCNTAIQYPYEVVVTRMENEGFGFVIISSVNKAGSTIGRIIEGSPAERCGNLNVGDHILAVNRVDITNACHKDIVNLIKDSGYSVTLTIGYPLDDCCSNTSLQKDDILGDTGDGGQYHAVELTRGTRGFGFSIRGGREFQNMPLFVLQIAENGPANIDNRLRVGDQIIEINGVNTKNMTHTEAIEIIRNGGPTVRLLVRRFEGGCQMPSVVGAPSHLYDMNI